MKCKDHPKYRGKEEPKNDCDQCWEIYEKKSANQKRKPYKREKIEY